MTYEEQMHASLTELLREGEKLMHPVYGLLKQDGEQYEAYFGFAGGDLLVAVLAGMQISNTIRVPLDVRSVKVKRSRVFRQYIIDVFFWEGAPCRITAAPRVLTIRSQKENLPQFLRHLQGLASEPEADEPTPAEPPKPDWRMASGEKIRRQYFNTVLYMILPVFPMVFVIVAGLDIKNGGFDAAQLGYTFFVTVATGIAVLWPLLLFSLLNRFWFGKTVCVLQEDGLLYQNALIPWEEIDGLIYCPSTISRRRIHRRTHALLCVRPKGKEAYTVHVAQLPLYAIKKIKKHAPDIRVRLDREGRVYILITALLPAVIGILFVLLG